MSENVELLDLDLRYEGHRLQDRAREARLLASIAARGVETPLEGVDTPEGRILLHGFQRWRCARKLQLASVPYVSLAQDQAMGILALMGASREKSLSVLEEAKFLLSWALEQMQRVGEDQESCNTPERVLLKELLLLQKTLRRVLTKCHDRRLTSRAFHAQANLLTAGLLADLPLFTKAMEEFHDRSGSSATRRRCRTKCAKTRSRWIRSC